MSKKLQDLKWESVALEGFPASLKDNFQGFVGLEECTSYGLDKQSKRPKKVCLFTAMIMISRKPFYILLHKVGFSICLLVFSLKNTTTNWLTNTLIGYVHTKRHAIFIFYKFYKLQKKPEKKRKNPAAEEKAPPNKKVKLSNGFIVETLNSPTPSLTNEENKNKKGKRKPNKKKKEKNELSDMTHKTNVNNETENKKKSKPKLGDNVLETPSLLTPEDMLTWAEFKLPESILKALAECGFKKPTNIQQLVLPAAIHGNDFIYIITAAVVYWLKHWSLNLEVVGSNPA